MVKILGISIGLIILLLTASIFTVGYMIAAPGYTGTVSDHFDGEVFYNPDVTANKGFLDFIQWQFSRDRGEWDEYTETEPGQIIEERIGNGDMLVTFVNHSTFLIQVDDLNILTDPVWADIIGPFDTMGLHRMRDPGILMEDIPEIDIILVSHNHYDHMDITTLKHFADLYNPRIYTPLGNKVFLEANGIFNVVEMDWWDESQYNQEVTIACVPAQHFSRRGINDHNKTLWAGFVMLLPSGKLFFAGDTGFSEHFQQIYESYGNMRLSLLPIGAYKPEWFMHTMHISPDEAFEVHKILNSLTSIGMHFGTFPLGDDGQYEAVNRIAELVENTDEGINNQFWTLDFGENRYIP